MSHRFAQLATIAARWFGSPWSFVGHLALVVALVCLWPVLGLDSMLLVLTTVLTVDTQLLAVLILNTQNRDARATHMKTDALIFAEPEATNESRNPGQVVIRRRWPYPTKSRRRSSSCESRGASTA